MLVQLIDAQMKGQNVAAGALCRALAKEGGIFGWTDSVEIALGMQAVIAIVRGQLRPDTPTNHLEEALEAIALLNLPMHPVTRLPQHRFPSFAES